MLYLACIRFSQPPLLEKPARCGLFSDPELVRQNSLTPLSDKVPVGHPLTPVAQPCDYTSHGPHQVPVLRPCFQISAVRSKIARRVTAAPGLEAGLFSSSSRRIFLSVAKLSRNYYIFFLPRHRACYQLWHRHSFRVIEGQCRVS